MKTKNMRAKTGLAEIRAMFKSSGITEAELQKSGRKIRRDLLKEQTNAKN
jgi:hypothetical protein